MFNIAIVGCGFVADFYMASLKYHPQLSIKGVYDINASRLKQFTQHYDLHAYDSFNDVLQDSSISMVLNLTNPRSHFAITKQLLEHNKHVYSEKPLAMSYTEAKELVDLAKLKELFLASAPCSYLSETSITISKAISEGAIGQVRLVYANFDSGMTHKAKPWNWRSNSGAHWPAKDEFEVGCTYQHAGYLLTWLSAYFGSANKVTAFSSCLLPDKGVPVDVRTPDFAVGCIEYGDNIVARVTSSIVAPVDKSLIIMGDEGTLYTRDVRDDASPVYITPTKLSKISGALEYRLDHWNNKLERKLNWMPWSWGNYWRTRRRYPYAIKPKPRYAANYRPVDFFRGPAKLAQEITQKSYSSASADFALHINELTEALQHPDRFGGVKKLESRCQALDLLA